LYVTGDPGAVDEAAKEGSLSLSIGLGWAKSLAFFTGQCPVMRYNRQLMMAILHDRVSIAKNVNATPISLDQPREVTRSSTRELPGSTCSTHMGWSASALPSDGGTSSQDRKYVAGPASH